MQFCAYSIRLTNPRLWTVYLHNLISSCFICLAGCSSVLWLLVFWCFVVEVDDYGLLRVWDVGFRVFRALLSDPFNFRAVIHFYFPISCFPCCLSSAFFSLSSFSSSSSSFWSTMCRIHYVKEPGDSARGQRSVKSRERSCRWYTSWHRESDGQHLNLTTDVHVFNRHQAWHPIPSKRLLLTFNALTCPQFFVPVAWCFF